MKTYQIRVHSGHFTILTPAGNVARTTSGEPFTTTEWRRAKEALHYLAQTRLPGAKRRGAHWLKSMFGTE